MLGLLCAGKQRNSMDWANHYLALGWAILPCFEISDSGVCACGDAQCRSPGKHPRVRSGVKDATTNPLLVAEWFSRWPKANLAVATGSISGLFVVDIDPKNDGDEAFRELEREHGPLPRAIACITGSLGEHIYFQHPGGTVRNSPLGRGLDIRGDGGYVVVPPSLHVSGRSYSWNVDAEPSSGSLTPAPGWLLRLFEARRTGGTSRPDSWRELVAEGVSAGGRNQAVAALAGHLLRRWVDPYVTLALVRSWNATKNNPPLPDDELTRTVASIAKIELRRRGVVHE